LSPAESESRNDALPRPINRQAALAVLPAGTGDDFARNLAGERAPLKRWIEAFIAHALGLRDQTTRTIDLLRVRTDN
jgi:diacylglycerol kinase family enzyme